MNRPDRMVSAMNIRYAVVHYKEKMKHQEPVGEEIALSMLRLGNMPKYWEGKSEMCAALHTK